MDRDAKRIVGEAIAVGVVQGAGVARVAPAPGRIIPLPSQDGPGTGGVSVQAELSQILLPDCVVRASSVNLAA
jgi:hypothetical protein